ncbi:glycosyl hydrolase family 65 protein [Clostridium sp. JN-9]|uniref:glycoside hydrolase family 65 protein n=1 Tax=Clostridium sp. JN-9 TaxID=2507159 RepID=UPI000FFE14CE|nr:glycosyl hydrolase family 65 protein [Clostridium sp. JN-9]QAT40602.1 glycoside hydrolase family 65 protein [Clostridium sp. JN-9]
MKDDWIVSDNSLNEKDLLKSESIFNVANGYIGIRGNFEEGYADNMPTIRGSYINAFYETASVSYGEKAYGYPETMQKIVNVTDSQDIDLIINNQKFSMFKGTVKSFNRYVNMKEGYYRREVDYVFPDGKEIKLKITRVASFKYLELFAINYQIEKVNFDDDIIIKSRINGDVKNYVDKMDMRVSSGNENILDVKSTSVQNDVIQVLSETKSSKQSVAVNTKHMCSGEFNVSYERHEKSVMAVFKVKPGNKIIEFNKYNIYTDSRRCKDPAKKGYTLINKICTLSFNEILKSQQNYLKRFWSTADIDNEGDLALKQGLRYNMYEILQSAGKDSVSNISAKGLSGEGYEGHYFWDSEIYILPFLTLCSPQIAKKLLRYRYTILDSARKRARELGHKKGAAYAWRTINGEECSSYFPAGTAQYHINGDIAYSYIQYYLVTGDMDFIKEFGAEVIFETARIWIEIGHYDNGLFKIDSVTGPNEYTTLVNNNYYTNVLAKYNLQWAVKIYNMLEEKDSSFLSSLCSKINLSQDEITGFQKAAQSMYLPYDSNLKINAQDDTFLSKAIWDFQHTPKDNYPLLLHYHPLTIYRYQVLKQPDTVLAHFLVENETNYETMKNSYDYYEKITTHDSSLSYAVYSIMASKLNYYDKAYKYFIKTARLDLDDTNGNTKDGIHTANMGGTWMAIVFGFAGLRIKENYIALNPKLPVQWNKLQFKFLYKGAKVKVTMGKSETKIQVRTKVPINLKVNDKMHSIANDSIICEKI